MSQVTFSKKAWEEYLYWQGEDKKTLKKINKLLKSIQRDGELSGEGKPEKLKFRENDYSRRINEADRLIYEVRENEIVVKSCKGHYEE